MIISSRLINKALQSKFISSRSYTTALTRKVASSLADALSLDPPPTPIHFNKAIQQHDDYVNLLRDGIGIKTIEIPADNSHPDCVFIEDTAIIVANVAVINRVGATSRRGEVDAVKDVLLDLGLDVHDMREDGSPDALLDGGDVLYPVDYEVDPSDPTLITKIGGNELFIGISSRTNLKGVEYMKKKYPRVNVVPVDISNLGELHLKSVTTHLDSNTLLFPTGSLGEGVAKAMNATERGYNIVKLKDPHSCNVLSINGTIVAQPTSCEQSRITLEAATKDRGMKLIWLNTTEFIKIDGCLTCQSILF